MWIQSRVEFEWDEAKRQSNLAKHGLDLLLGSELFDGRPTISYDSPRNDELRSTTIGIVGGMFLALAWTMRGNTIRLISLRKARNAEQRTYYARQG